jgi:carbonic anhydrase
MPVIGTQQSPIQVIHDNSFYAIFRSSYFEISRYEPDDFLDGHFAGDNFEFTQPPRGLIFEGSEWFLHRIHFHAPAEHLIDSAIARPYEVHLIHFHTSNPYPTGPKVVVGGFFEEREGAKERKSFAILNDLLRENQRDSSREIRKAPAPKLPVRINPNDFLPDHPSRWYHYQGSLTSGTFSEDVSWFIMPDSYGVPASQLNVLASGARQNPRPFFPLDRRFILRSFE